MEEEEEKDRRLLVHRSRPEAYTQVCQGTVFVFVCNITVVVVVLALGNRQWASQSYLPRRTCLGFNIIFTFCKTSQSLTPRKSTRKLACDKEEKMVCGHFPAAAADFNFIWSVTGMSRNVRVVSDGSHHINEMEWTYTPDFTAKGWLAPCHFQREGFTQKIVCYGI